MNNNSLDEESIENAGSSIIEDSMVDLALPTEIPSERNSEPSEQRSFAAILEGLRTVEDSFYFLVEEGRQLGLRILVQGAEMLIGWDDSRLALTSDPLRITVPCLIIRKDWTGVMVEAQDQNAIQLNGLSLLSSRRLRNGDQLSLAAPVDDPALPAEQALLVFHEPASLVVLDSLLPSTLPPPVAVNGPASGPAANQALERQSQLLQATGVDKLYFGYFSFFELLMMAAATLALSAIIFFVLDNT